MKKIKTIVMLITFCLIVLFAVSYNKKDSTKFMDTAMTYKFPEETQEHEATWLIWPHEHTYGKAYAQSIEYIWVTMTKYLTLGEKVNIIIYDEPLQKHVEELLNSSSVDMKKVHFFVAKSDDVWVRDTGPIFVYDDQNRLNIADFKFDGWGEKMPYENDDTIPVAISKYTNIPSIDISSFVLEGGAIEVSKDGTVLATKSAVISKNRNSDMTQKQAEQYLTTFLGAKNFIWLDGVTDEDITDAHIDGLAKFYDEKTILSVPKDDFFELYENIKESDYDILRHAKNASGEYYNFIDIPLTSKNVAGLSYKGSYLNFYVANKVVLLPVYDDENDSIAIDILSKLYPDREIVPINVVPLYKNGGMIHCVTQQQPVKISE
ncbi:agmatine deiminase family protein [Streptococcus suis]|nr:agmatine deiminase family protein [Streptococcus suis]